jgi:hypothetical protein
VERAPRFAAAALVVGLSRGGEGLVAEDGRERADLAIDGVDAGKVSLGDLFGADLSGGEQA